MCFPCPTWAKMYFFQYRIIEKYYLNFYHKTPQPLGWKEKKKCFVRVYKTGPPMKKLQQRIRKKTVRKKINRRLCVLFFTSVCTIRAKTRLNWDDKIRFFQQMSPEIFIHQWKLIPFALKRRLFKVKRNNAIYNFWKSSTCSEFRWISLCSLELSAC